MNDELSFGIIAKKRRRELGLTQDELARRVGCAPITLRKIEADDLRPSVQIAERLAMALNIPMEERAAFVKLARTERAPAEEHPITPMPTPEEIGLEDLSGRAIRGYALGERLGNGGMGAVYRAVQPLVEREVAIKIILPKYANQPDFIRRFEAEAQLVARLEHPHIVPLYDYWREPGVAYLIMRLLRGGSVHSLLRSGTVLEPETVLRMMEQIGSALSSAHRAGVVHRDLKPANVLLDEDNNAYLADFGIAKNLSSPSSDTQADMIMGSLDYISPEQIRSEYIRPQTDIYALGVMLYELLTGKLPFLGPTPFDVMRQHMSEPLPPLAANRMGLPDALDDVIEHATAKDPLQRYETVDEMLEDIRDALGANLRNLKGRASASQKVIISLAEIDNPYKGLRAFGEGDAQDFFGRESLTQQLLVRLGESGELSRFLAVVGPSGSGKSSVVKAGLIPALRRGGLPGSENWFILEMMPGSHPLEELEAALLRIAVNPPSSLLEQFQKDNRGLVRAVRRSLPVDPNIELVLVIDQFEEVFTLLQDENERQHFLGLLVTAVLDEQSRIRVILTLRADFIDRPLNYVDFGELLHRRMEIVLPLTSDELERAIVSPAERVGLQFEPGLISAILHDLGDEPGTLPLLQYALTELYEKREGYILSKSAYQNIGGVLGALGRRAEEIFTGLNLGEQAIAKQLFLRLVILGEGVEDTRRRAAIFELENLQVAEMDSLNFSKSLNATLDAFGRARLLSFGRDPDTRRPTVEVAHEAIIREWARLRNWLNESRSLVRMQRQLALAASEWEGAQHDDSFLLAGTKLAQYEGWTANSVIALTQQEVNFLKTSFEGRDKHAMEEAARQKRELEIAQKLAETERSSAQHLQNRNRVISVIGVIALVLAALAGVFAFNSNRNARQAEQAAKLSTSRELAAASISNLDIDPERSILLALQGLSVQYSSEAENALRRSLATSQIKWTLPTDNDVYSLAFGPDGKNLAIGEDGVMEIWDIQTGKKILKNFTNLINKIIYNPISHLWIIAEGHGSIMMWDPATGKWKSFVYAYQDGICSMALTPDSAFLATAGCTEPEVNIWDTASGKTLYTLMGHTAAVTDVTFNRDGTHLATVSNDGNARIWNIKTGENILTFPIGGGVCLTDGTPRALFNANGTILITSDNCGNIYFWDISVGESKLVFHKLVRGGGGYVPLKLNPDGTLLAVGGGHGVLIMNAATGDGLFSLPSEWKINDMDFSSDGKYIAAGGIGENVEVWDLSLPGEKLVLTAHGGHRTGDVSFSPDGKRLATESADASEASVWDMATGKRLLAIQSPGICCTLAFSPDGARLAIGSLNGDLKIWDATTGKLASVLSGHTDAISRVAFSPDGTRIATAGSDGIVKIWDAHTYKELLSFIVRNGGTVNFIVFSPDSKLLATTDNDASNANGETIIWDAKTGKLLFFLGFTGTNVGGLAFSPDGKHLAAGYFDNLARIWDISPIKDQSKPLLELYGHSSVVWRVAFSPDGNRLVTASYDGTIKLWDISQGPTQGQEIATLTGHTAEVSGIAFSPDGKYLASVSWDGTLRVYFMQLEDLIAYAKTRVTRTLTTEECQKYLHVDACPVSP